MTKRQTQRQVFILTHDDTWSIAVGSSNESAGAPDDCDRQTDWLPLSQFNQTQMKDARSKVAKQLGLPEANTRYLRDFITSEVLESMPAITWPLDQQLSLRKVYWILINEEKNYELYLLAATREHNDQNWQLCGYEIDRGHRGVVLKRLSDIKALPFPVRGIRPEKGVSLGNLVTVD